MTTMPKAQPEQLRAHLDRLRQLTAQVAEIGFISSGNLVRRFMPCGKPGCRCQADPPQLHGPYWQWTKRMAGKTSTRRLTEAEAILYQQWIDNRRRVLQLLDEMEEVSWRAAPFLVQDTRQLPQPPSQQPNLAPNPPIRITKRLALALTQLSELLDPLADAARQWLDAKDDGDPDLLAEARQDLLTAWTHVEGLRPALDRLTQLARSN